MSRKFWTIFFLVLLGWFGLTAFQSSVAFGYGYGGGLLLAGGALFIGLAVSTLKGWRSGSWQPVGWCLTGLGLLISSVGAAWWINHLQKNRAVRNAQPLLAEIIRFHAQTGKYPASIADLKPAFPAGEPRPGIAFGSDPYWVSMTPDGFTVAFHLPDWQTFTYDSRTGNWQVVD